MAVRKLKTSLGGWVLVAIFGVVPIALWLPLVLDNQWSALSSWLRAAAQLSGVVGASFLSLNFVLSARLAFIEDWLHGLPRVYTLHHLLGGLALILLVLHPLFMGMQYVPLSLQLAADFYIPSSAEWAKGLGVYALTLLVVLLVITFYVKIPYQSWRSTHKWLGLPLVLATLHVLFIPGDISGNTVLRLYMVGLLSLGLLSFAYRTLFGRRLVKRYRYIVEKVVPHGKAGTEVVMRPKEEQIEYRAGQFFFIETLANKHVSAEAHPFSFTSRPSDDVISIAAKPVGDYTSALSRLKKGETVLIEGPYGRFWLNVEFEQQVWIAGGIGITPFMSMLRSLPEELNGQITLFYIVANRSEALFLPEIEQIAAKVKGLTLIVWESGVSGRFEVSSQLSAEQNVYYMVCGPLKFMQEVKRHLRQGRVDSSLIAMEEFSLY